MPLKKGFSRKVFEENYAEMKRAGHTHEQALAACYNVARETFFKRHPRGALPTWLAFPDGRRVLPARKKNPTSDPVIAIAEWCAVNQIPLTVFNKMVIEHGKRPQTWRGREFSELHHYVTNPSKRGRNPVPESTKSARHSKEARIKMAADQYERFTGHDATELVSIDKPTVPDVMSVIGEIDGVMYTTVRDGETEKYIHEFKKNCRPLFCVSPDGKQIFMIGGSYDFTERGIVDRTR